MIPRSLGLIVLALTCTGCAGLDRVGTKLDMMAGRVMEKDGVIFEGQLQAARRVGSMIALQFIGGQMYDVEDAPFEFVPGDIVRIYKNYKGYYARLWRSREDEKTPSIVNVKPAL